MEENIKIKEELFSLYKEIKNNIKEDKVCKDDIEDLNSSNSLSLINKIKENLTILLNQNLSIENFNNNQNDEDNNEKLLLDYAQLESQIKKLEIDNKYYLKNFLSYKIQKDSLEMKLNAYMSLEEEYEELKEKVRYEGGKFLENDRNDNEIIIIRAENSALKKEITKIENKNKNNEMKNKDYQNKIKEFQNTIDNLNKKIYKLEKIIKDNTIKNNILNRNNTNSCTNLRIKSNENIPNYNSDYSLANLNNIVHLNNNNNNKRLPNFRSPKNENVYFERNHNSSNNTINAVNSNMFSPSYNKVINGISNRKIILPVKKEFNIIKHQRNNSISVLRERENNKNKTLNDKYLQKPGNIVKNNQLFYSNSKTNNLYPLSCKNSKNNNGQIVRKYIKKEMIKNSSYHNIKAESKM